MDYECHCGRCNGDGPEETIYATPRRVEWLRVPYSWSFGGGLVIERIPGLSWGVYFSLGFGPRILVINFGRQAL